MIGNNDYRNVPKLQKAVNDARAMGNTLRKLGFEVMIAENQTRQGFAESLLAFDNAVEQGELQRLILRLRDEGTSILLIEHILPLLFGVSERVMVMDFGRKLTEGPPSDIAKDPRVIEAYLGGKAMESLHAA
ncbi:MAG: caspase family protein [Rhizobiales bacterium]|nr:caspase family protein [Hyphomicrobiales bacterium]